MGESARPRPSAGMPGWPRGWAGRPSRRAMLRGHRGNHTIEAEDPIHLQTALEILQQQLESFQTFQKQTLENANMVQFEISDIVNQNIFEMKTPVHISAKIMTTAHISCTATNASLPMEYPELLPSKRKVHHDQQSFSEEYVEARCNTGNVVSDIKNSHKISVKTEKVENSENLIGNKRILTINNEFTCGHLVSGTDLETERLDAAQEKVIFSKSKLPIHLPEYRKEFCKINDNNYPTKLLKQEFWKSVSINSDLLAQNTEKSVYRAKLNNLKEVAKIVTTSDKSHIASVPLNENCLHFGQEFYKDSECASVWGSPTTTCNEKADSESRNILEEFKSSCNESNRCQVNLFSKMVKNKLQMLDHKQQLGKEQLAFFNQTLLRRGDQKFSENKLAPEYDGEIEALHKSLKNSEHVQKRVHYLQNENLTLRNNVKSLADTIQSLKEKISKYNMKIKDLAKEKRSMQIQLVKLPEGNEECVKEVKNLLRKCKELQNQKIILEKEKNQHHNGNKDTIQALHDFQIRNKKSEEKMTAGSCEKGRLNVTLESLKHKCSNSQETNKKLDIKIRQFTEEKSSLEQEFEGNQSEIQQMKEKETAPKSELETPLQLMQTLPEEKLNLEMTLQECSNTKQMLLKDINKVQSDKVYTEKKLMTELRNTKADIDLLKYNLTTANTEYKRLSKVITDIAEENQLLKKELNEYRQYASKYENDIRKLTEECLLLENHLQTIENERDVLQLEFRRLHKNFVYLQGQATSLAWAQKKPYSSSGIMENNCYSEHSTRTCKEIPDLEYLSQGNEKITKIRKKIQEEELKRWKEK
ncbi:coiled-coil domain-containing protein 110 isoform X1 [Numida meleagris]|uniref:coiled-coil domain-containing protein 110 isoform X1 n=1 Tax=Numida meleagris TaxID=8996 RepID=UPI000B3E1B5F|nr:coiled-coil domain-containing protein 110 isoform X1 [Numida meleagris]